MNLSRKSVILKIQPSSVGVVVQCLSHI